MLQIKHLLIAACGTSLYASKYGAKLMRSLHAFESVATEDASECTSDRFLKKDGLGEPVLKRLMYSSLAAKLHLPVNYSSRQTS